MGGNKDVSYHAPNADDWAAYEDSLERLSEFKTPKLFDANDKHSYLYIVLADGTENDLSDPMRYTNVAKLSKELLNNTNDHIDYFYMPGVGTTDKDGFFNKTVAKLDAMASFSDRQRAEEIYTKFSDQAREWKEQDPQAKIAVMEVGFSRGCGVIARFNDMLHQRGVEELDSRGGESHQTHIIEPGTIPQAVLVYDPVTTYMSKPLHKLPPLSPSTVSALQIDAKNEYRDLFPLTKMTKGSTQLEVAMPGCHSDIGGGYKENGLSKYSFALGKAYLESMTDTQEKLFKDVRLPSRDDPKVVIHNSVEHHIVYKLDKIYNKILNKKDVPRGVEHLPDSLGTDPKWEERLTYAKMHFSATLNKEMDNHRFQHSVIAFLKQKENRQEYTGKPEKTHQAGFSSVQDSIKEYFSHLENQGKASGREHQTHISKDTGWER